MHVDRAGRTLRFTAASGSPATVARRGAKARVEFQPGAASPEGDIMFRKHLIALALTGAVGIAQGDVLTFDGPCTNGLSIVTCSNSIRFDQSLGDTALIDVSTWYEYPATNPLVAAADAGMAYWSTGYSTLRKV
jgi:hypothetical protein